MSSLATIINFTSDILASCFSAAAKLSSFSFASIDKLNLNYAPLLIYSSLLSFACYFAFNSLAVMNNILKTPNDFNQEEYNDSEIELSSIDPLVQLKLIKEESTAEPEVIDTTLNSASTANTEKRAESSNSLAFYQPSKVFQRSRRNSFKSRSKGPNDIGYVNLSFTFTGPDNNIVVPPNHERITLIDDNVSDIIADPQKSGALPLEKKPFEYYLSWDLSIDELEQLSYSEKSRRFYLLSKYGELNQETKPPEKSQLEVKQETKPSDTAQFEVEELPPEPAKPMNLISDVVQQASCIDISTFQVQLLKLNHQLVQSHLKRIEMRKFNFSPLSILREIFDLSIKYQLKQPAINIETAIDDRSNRKSLRGSFPIHTNQCYAIGYNIFNPKLRLLKFLICSYTSSFLIK